MLPHTTSHRYRNLSNNQLTTLPVGLFDSLTSLRWLYVAGAAQKRSVGRRVLVTLPCTTHVRRCCPTRHHTADRQLNNNQLTTLPAGLFDSLTSLANLYVAGAVQRRCEPELRARCHARLTSGDAA